MNKINKVKNIDWYIEEIKKCIVSRKVKKENFEEYYLLKENKYTNYLLNLGISLNDFSNKYTDSIFENFIVAEYKDLKKIYSKIKSYNRKNDILTEFVKIYKNFSVKNVNNVIVNKMNVQVCPYCNENYIINRGKKYASAQLDHFYNKKENPLFVICLYNIIPCCPTCNHIKLTKELNVSPYDEAVNREELKISYDIESLNWLNNYSDIKVNFKINGKDGQKIYDDIKDLNIIQSYKCHNDYIQELIKKRLIYNDSYINELKNLFSDLIIDENELIRIIFGNYIKEDDINKRPLSKLTQDILEELNVEIK